LSLERRGARLPLFIAFSFVNIVFDLNFNQAVLPERVSIDWLGYLSSTLSFVP
jgi:hypothetical protein